MKRLDAITLSLPLLLTSFATAQQTTAPVSQTMTVTRNGSQPTQRGSAEYFSGTVHVTPLFTAPSPARASGAIVVFEAGARSAWHTHPLGQTLVVTEGTGLVQQWGGAIETIRKGDVVWTPPGVKHWHGASATTAMTHTAIQELSEGRNVNWLEKVSDEQYNKQPAVLQWSVAEQTQVSSRAKIMNSEPSAIKQQLGDFAPKLVDVTDKVLFGDIWERTELAPRERSLITVAALVAGGNSEQLPFHLNKAKENGLSEADLIEVITHLAFYSGWPKAMSAIQVAKEVFKK